MPAGIIPARAGFTKDEWRPAEEIADHPRSRGVYLTDRHRALLSRGSSPLARGLRMLEKGVTVWHRIIPARAGFTDVWQTYHHLVTDHPRSRGVYRVMQA